MFWNNIQQPCFDTGHDSNIVMTHEIFIEVVLKTHNLYSYIKYKYTVSCVRIKNLKYFIIFFNNLFLHKSGVRIIEYNNVIDILRSFIPYKMFTYVFYTMQLCMYYVLMSYDSIF